MKDMIYRKAAIDAIDSVLVEDESCKVWFKLAVKNLPSAQPYTDKDIQKIQDIEQAQLDKIRELAYQDGKADAMRWIPCSERLPFAEFGESDNVLTTCGYRDVKDTSVRWIRLLYFNGGNWCYPTGETYEQKVYAWMPLPEPYKGGDHGRVNQQAGGD